MPYGSVAALPDAVRQLPEKKQRQFMRVFNSVWKRFRDLGDEERERKAFASAWASVKEQLAPEFNAILIDLVERLGETRGRECYQDWVTTHNLEPTIPLFMQFRSSLKMTLFQRPPIPEDRSQGFNKLENLLKFQVLDKDKHIVGGYASTTIADCEGERLTLDLIHREGKKYMGEGGKKGVIYLIHGLTELEGKEAGIILPEFHKDGKVYTTHFDQLGWYVVSQPTPEDWQLIEQGVLNGYSVGFKNWSYCPDNDLLITDAEFYDLSYVPYSCNELCHFQALKMDKTSSSSGMDDKRKIGKNLEDNTMSTKPTDTSGTIAKPTSNVPDPNVKKILPNAKTGLPSTTVSDPNAKTGSNEGSTETEEVDLMSLNIPDLIERLKTKAKEEVQLELAKAYTASEKRIAEAKSEDRFDKVLKILAEFKADMDSFKVLIAEIKAKVDSQELRVVKMENIPVVKAGFPTEGKGTGLSPTELAMATPIRNMESLRKRLAADEDDEEEEEEE